MSRRSHTFNGYQSTLPNPITAGQDVIGVSTVAGLQAPGKLVIDHDLPATREWFSYAGISGLNLTGCVRGLAGASGAGGGVAHAQGAIVQAVPMHQLFDDLWDDLEDVVDAATAHSADTNPHPGYATDGELATTNAQVAVHTTQIGALEDADILLGTDVDNLQLADTAHFGSTTGHPVATETTDGLISAADLVKLRRMGSHCRVGTSAGQTYGDGSNHFIVFDVETFDLSPVPIHTADSSLFTIPYTGIWSARFRNTALVIFNRTVLLREGSTPGTGTSHVMIEGRDLGTGEEDPQQNVWVSGPLRLTAGTQLRVEAVAKTGAGTSVASGSNFTLAYGSTV